MLIPDFIARCDAYCAASGQSRVWLSKRLFNDTFKLENLATAASDVGVRRLHKAHVDLSALERALKEGHGDRMPDRPQKGAENSRRNVSRTYEPGSSVEVSA